MGDLVECTDGRLAAVRWIGKRSYAGRFLQANPALRPVRFRAGSLGPGTPSRDLLVSPKHAMLVDGVLVPAELLVNGHSITVERGQEQVDYFHIELDRHSAVWAEDAASETFIDDGSRGMFHNPASYGQLYGDAPADMPEFCAPRVTDGPALQAILHRLALFGETVQAA